jgi:hypothetical protein
VCVWGGGYQSAISNSVTPNRSVRFVYRENRFTGNRTNKFSARLDGSPNSTIQILNSGTDLGGCYDVLLFLPYRLCYNGWRGSDYCLLGCDAV